MDNNARLQLNRMISENDVQDQTQLIRELKHSHFLKEDINTLVMLKVKHINDPDGLHLIAMSECSFLFTYYTDIYNKIRKDEIDLKMLFEFIDILQQIENGKIDQHEASFSIGTILKNIYIDSALKKADKLDQENTQTNIEYIKPIVNLSWKEFKEMNK